jgi:protein-S-isoprenylcysteine O-methyltransferase Ste14
MKNAPPLEASDHSEVWIPAPLIFVAAFFVALFLQKYLPLPAIPAPLGRIVGIAFISAGILIALWSVSLFGRARTTVIPIKPAKALVIEGPYRFTRNPMYLGMLSAYIGAALLRHLLWAVLLTPVVILAVHYLVIWKEEQYLERKFGGEFVGYKARVRRWL